MTTNVVDCPLIIPPLARFSSKKDDKNDEKSFPLTGISKPAKNLLTPAPEAVVNKLKKLSQKLEKSNDMPFFDEVIQKTSSINFRVNKMAIYFFLYIFFSHAIYYFTVFYYVFLCLVQAGRKSKEEMMKRAAKNQSSTFKASKLSKSCGTHCGNGFPNTCA